jgi:hypothetical protein
VKDDLLWGFMFQFRMMAFAFGVAGFMAAIISVRDLVYHRYMQFLEEIAVALFLFVLTGICLLVSNLFYS